MTRGKKATGSKQAKKLKVKKETIRDLREHGGQSCKMARME